MKNILSAIIVCGALSLVVQQAEAVSFDISWTGAGNYTMEGSFSYSDTLIGTGRIDETSLTSFNIEGFLSGTSLGTFDFFTDTPLLGSDTFNFNFDSTSETFYTGGYSADDFGQDWGVSIGGGFAATTGFGFSSGSGSQGIANPSWLSVSSIPVSQSTLIATRSSDPVPEPATMLLFGTGLIGLAGSRIRRKK
ncbi:hypothetical protein DGMP_38840 [Desulfomarina profundi]|uniref:Ice-binding protein C-terminal domain-containing protein n=1 Tax=Desulfomarina profundi TaxID=2772557 RepID=A0A8D5FXG9_9BACT|nr:PEP-CTERM sorting domain-containing protein [Desulfomarina profundi]BCL63191.1 hypothetical protein DGMP_38840 [Desulfomarina profundi]